MAGSRDRDGAIAPPVDALSPSLWQLGAAMVAGAAAVEIASLAKLRDRLGYAGSIMGRASRMLQSRRISDHWKERAATAYSARLIRSVAGLAITLMAAVAPCAVLLRLSADSWRMAMLMAISPPLLAAVTLGSVGWWWLRRDDPAG